MFAGFLQQKEAAMSTIGVNGADQATMTRVISHDGTQIAYWTSGEGPPLVLVPEIFADHILAFLRDRR